MTRTPNEERRRTLRRSPRIVWSPLSSRRPRFRPDRSLKSFDRAIPVEKKEGLTPHPRPRVEFLYCTRCGLSMSPGRSQVTRERIQRGELRPERILCQSCLEASRATP